MNIDTSHKKSLKDMSAELKRQDSSMSFLNSTINIALLGKEIFNKKASENFFDIDSVSKVKRFEKATQNLYLEELLKASTPNYKVDDATFTFNKKERIGWVILEFDIDPKISSTLPPIQRRT